uniref:Uncharacterized protein n=1 Tax=Avena sativa TaxID=4498 RepID=A0ACD6ABG2_AVESA
MGPGGRSTTREVKEGHAIQRPPTDKPSFTLAQIKKAIPPHCFDRSLIKSSYYLLRDLAIVAVLLYFSTAVIPAIPAAGLPRLAAWTLYWVAQGCAATGVWVIAHECGHHAFSDYPLLNDALGLVLHSWLLVPYFSWKFSHRRHHSNNASLERDEVFVPQHKATLPWYAPCICNPVGRLLFLAALLAIGWPVYLTFNTKGRAYPRWANHFDPYGPIFSDRERVLVLVTDVGLLAVCFALFKLAAAFGFWWVVRVYGVPLLVVNAWLVLITYLHHTHVALPHYDSSEWDWLRGALATVDRDYGFFLNTVFHHIADTHVVHHLFSAMPHYHAMEATKAIRPLLGDYYKFDATPIAKALWREAKECIFVEPMEEDRKGVLWYSNNL